MRNRSKNPFLVVPIVYREAQKIATDSPTPFFWWDMPIKKTSAFYSKD